VGFDGFKNLLAQLVLLQQVSEGQDRRLIGDPVADQLDAGKVAHGGHLDQGLLHGRVVSEYHCCNRWMRSMVASG